jgi:hypothetical protein
MKHRRVAGLFSELRARPGRRLRGILAIAIPAASLAIALVGTPAGVALAQDNQGGSINIGGSIADTVAGAVAGIATNSGGGTVSGETRVEHNDLHFGDDEGLAIADSSGGNHNIGADSK